MKEGKARHHGCAHPRPVCINPYELIRKYRCGACGAVMMCACDEVFGRRFLPHQLSTGTELKTRKRIPVTSGFQPKVCSECRGLPAKAAPAAEIHGRTSKIKRYYWRELYFEETSRRADWDASHPEATDAERGAAHAAVKAQVLAEIKARHVSAPKYVVSEPSQNEVLKRYDVELLQIAAEYVEVPQKGAVIQSGNAVVSAEAFVTCRFESAGWSVMPLESRPFHALFGVMMWLLIEDVADSQNRIVEFGDRVAFEAGESRPIRTLLPDDFGSEGYSVRRKRAITRHFKMLPNDRAELLWLFDYWCDYSINLRQYLWAHRQSDVDRARSLIEILLPAQIHVILRYLIANYWGHYLGWPDLLLHRKEEILFIEVKSSGDRLSQNQKGWIADNHNHLHLPFKLVKLVRAPQKTNP